MQKQYSTPSQDKTRQQIEALESKLNSLLLVRDSGLSSSSVNQEIKEGRLELEKLKKSLKRKVNNAEQQQKTGKNVNWKIRTVLLTEKNKRLKYPSKTSSRLVL